MLKYHFLVFARDKKHVKEKIEELKYYDIPYLIICGERLDHPNILFRRPVGKYDAINFGIKFIPKDTDIIIMNDVDTKIHNFFYAIKEFEETNTDVLFATEFVKEGPQNLFFKIFNPIRKILPLAASGELMLIKKDLIETIIPLKPCKAEDTYILFKMLESGHKIQFSDEIFAETERTKTPKKEESYKRKTLTGIYQALSYTNPPILIKIFYLLLPFLSPFLLIFGKNGYYWMRGIVLGFIDYIRGDVRGYWDITYLL